MDNQTAGVDLDDLMTYPSPHGTLVRLADVKCRLARRAEPSVAAGDERALYMRAIDSMYPVPNNPHQSVVQRAMDARIAFTHGWDAARAALASPAVPEGYKLVPLKCTPEMRAAWERAPQSEDDDVEFHGAYRAMIDAAPAPAAQKAGASHAANAGEDTGLREAASAVVARWDSVLWRQEVGTNELINKLRAAIASSAAQEGK
jgi:hypothetical protein